MISQIIKVEIDNKMKYVLYYSNGDKKCETLLFYHFLYRLSLHSKRGLKYRELLLTSTTLFKRISPKNSFSFFWNIDLMKVNIISLMIDIYQKLDMILAMPIKFKT